MVSSFLIFLHEVSVSSKYKIDGARLSEKNPCSSGFCARMAQKGPKMRFWSLWKIESVFFIFREITVTKS